MWLVLFFTATNTTRGDMHKLAAVEATQSGELIFSLLGEVFLLHGNYPSALSGAGIALIVLGMIGHSLASHKTKKRTSVADPVSGTFSDKLS
ncbi:multidrug resistance efflux transporter family protein [Acididesulfobacillus acetoxydans]|uniref:multidrug resistance efflux transporter family protein n=1 Tax=Acididesulfobacillus acetoxydans TaxID=1561005 RepID=UPI003B84AECE